MTTDTDSKEETALNIAIDGPAGAGKSSIAVMAAKELGSVYVDTGAMYRAMALHMLRLGVSPEDTGALERACVSADISIRYEGGEQRVLLGGEDVTGLLRDEKVGNMASSVSACPKVREKLVELQQKLAASTPVVMDGRDIGTVVLPDAELKIYLTADPRVRAERRARQLYDGELPGEEALQEIEKDIRERDLRDMTRETSPLRKADDAVVVDSSSMTTEEVLAEILRLAREASGGDGTVC